MEYVNSKKSVLFLILFCILLITGLFFIQKNQLSYASDQVEKEKKIQSTFVLHKVAFSSQDPTGRWKNPFFETGCEETAVIMAMHWVYNTPLTKAIAIEEITSLTNFEIKKFGGFHHDLSGIDTVALMKDYYGYEKITLVKNITTNDIIRELVKGNLVLVPANGDKLHNIYYRGEVPAHMILVVGYNPATLEFITNDSGTQYGKGYRYKKSIMEGALRDYPTGSAEEIIGIEKNMIVVEPQDA